MSNLLAIVGIALVLVGTVWTVTATLRAPELLMYPDFQYGAEHVIRVVDRARRRGWDNYPAEVREAALQHADEEHEADLERLAKRSAQQHRTHHSAIVRGSLIGLTLIAVGSVCQGVAILLVGNAT